MQKEAFATFHQNRHRIQRIRQLALEKQIEIFAHQYQLPEIHYVADRVGSTLELLTAAQSVDKKRVMMCGVFALAESLGALYPEKQVYFPGEPAECPMAEHFQYKALMDFKSEYPGVPLLSHVMSNLETKAESVACCTASNASEVVGKLWTKGVRKLLVAPDRHLGYFLSRRYIGSEVMTSKATTSKALPIGADLEILSWRGFCVPYGRVTVEEIYKAQARHPDLRCYMHAACPPEVQALGHIVGGSTQLLQAIKEAREGSMLVAAEPGLIARIREENPEKIIHSISPGIFCYMMKQTTLEILEAALESLDGDTLSVTAGKSEFLLEAAGKALKNMWLD